MKINLHTHTTRCHHAQGTDEEYVQAAIRAGYTTLGFSDHTPFPYQDGFVNTDKMHISQLEDYIASVQGLKEKYADRIRILMGLECEAVPEFFPFLAEMRQRMDYLLLGNHGDKRVEPFSGSIGQPRRLWKYVEDAVRGMETGLFLYLAHPDLMLNRYPRFDEDARNASAALCREAKRLRIPLEYNLLGASRGRTAEGLGYPCRDFWEIAAREGNTAVVGVDAHAPEQLERADLDGAAAYLRELGLRVLSDPLDAAR